MTLKVTFTSAYGSLEGLTVTDDPFAPVVEQLAVLVTAAVAEFAAVAVPIVSAVAVRANPIVRPIFAFEWFIFSPCLIFLALKSKHMGYALGVINFGLSDSDDDLILSILGLTSGISSAR
ncbi:hypothetical protein ACFXKG_05970 [Streptomyces sp. NPDC059255]|uniref:hypothetical protein n=1 Tax=Streptomyces sp. NPDC059255 TaxID=3346793 RepID=UPI003688AC6F